MKIKQIVRNLMVAGLLVLPVVAIAGNPSPTFAAECGGVETSIISCTQPGANNTEDGAEVRDTGLWGLLILTLNIMLAGVGVLAVAGVVWGSILYTSAGGNSEQVKKAIGVFTNVVIGVVAFAGMWVLLNFLIPGGAFDSL